MKKPKAVSLIEDIADAKNLLGYDDMQFDSLHNLDRGPLGSNMKTLGLHCVVQENAAYQITSHGLVLLSEYSETPINLESRAQNPTNVELPPFVEIDAIWDKSPYFSGDSNNILGDNGRLFINMAKLSIPAIIATDATLAYYGATLIKEGDIISFSNEAYPIWYMRISDQYVNQYLMTEEGGGFYLEYHLDQPHYHHAIHGLGYYLLAKWAKNDKKLQMTAFQIPNGMAIYTKKGALHCDAALFGEYLVGYTTSKNYSTVLIRTVQNLIVQIDFLTR